MFRHVLVLTLFVLSANARVDPIEILTGFREIIHESAMECMTTNAISLSPDQFSLNGISRIFKCLIACVAQFLTIVDARGNLIGQEILDRYPEQMPGRKELETVIKDCSDKGGADSCQGTIDTFRCVIRERIIRSGFGRSLKRVTSLFWRFFN